MYLGLMLTEHLDYSVMAKNVSMAMSMKQLYGVTGLSHAYQQFNTERQDFSWESEDILLMRR